MRLREGTLSVRDHGPGFDERDLPHVFDRFYRADAARSTDSGRVGLGLAIVRSIVALHGGSATVASTLGEGTRITLVFPGQPSAAGVERNPAPTA